MFELQANDMIAAGEPAAAAGLDALRCWLDQRPAMMAHGVLLVLALGGLTLVMLGRPLMRPMCALGGLLVGAAVPLLVDFTSLGGTTLPWVAGGAVVGAVVAWFLFRLWMGLALGATLCGCLPIAVLTWNGPQEAATPPPPELTLEALESLGEPDAAPAVSNWLREQALESARDLRQRWDSAETREKFTAVLASFGSGVGGLVLGMLAPNWGSAMLCSLAGSGLLLVSLQHWLTRSSWDAPQWLSRPSGAFIAVGLITILGILLQWIFFKPRKE
jgi:hypothetical protein